MYTGMNSYTDTYQQFLIDAPRIKICVDDKPWQGDAAALYNHILNNYSNGHDIAFWCTQTALAGIYFKKVSQIRNLDLPIQTTLHLLDGGKQTITLHASSIVIRKPFHVCTVDSEAGRLIQARLLLTVHVYENSTITIEWTTQKSRTTDAKIAGETYKTDAQCDDTGGDEPEYEIIDRNDPSIHSCKDQHLEQEKDNNKIGVAMVLALALVFI